MIATAASSFHDLSELFFSSASFTFAESSMSSILVLDVRASIRHFSFSSRAITSGLRTTAAVSCHQVNRLNGWLNGHIWPHMVDTNICSNRTFNSTALLHGLELYLRPALSLHHLEKHLFGFPGLVSNTILNCSSGPGKQRKTSHKSTASR